jgi:hypothetical protein
MSKRTGGRFTVSRQREPAHFRKIVDEESQSDLSVELTIYDIPESLLIEYAQKVVQPHYPEGISVAIKDLMQKAVEKVQKGKIF